jgi:hypothetical protein
MSFPELPLNEVIISSVRHSGFLLWPERRFRILLAHSFFNVNYFTGRRIN